MTTPTDRAVHRPRPVDRTVAWVLYVLQLLGSVLLGLASITAVFMTDSCGTSSDDALVCNVGYFGGVLIGYWAMLVALAILVPCAIVLTTNRGRASWPWAVGGIVLTAAASVLFVFLMIQ